MRNTIQKKVKGLIFFLSVFICVIGGNISFAQSPTIIKLKCQSPYGSIYGKVQIAAVGNILYDPCPTKSSIFTQTVNFSAATVIGLPFTVSPLTTKGDIWGYSTVNTRIPVGANGTVLTADSTNARGVAWVASSGITGSGTANFIPRFTAGTVIGNTPFSWDNITYTWNQTGLACTFCMDFKPSSTNIGTFSIGQLGAGYFNVNNSTSTILVNGTAIDNDSQTGIFRAGDVNTSGNSTLFTLDDTAGTILNTAGTSIINNSKTGIFQAGDIASAGNSTVFTVNDVNKLFLFHTGVIKIDNDCVGADVALGGAGTRNLALTTCWAIADAEGTAMALVIGTDALGILRIDSAGLVTSSLGAADAGKRINYWIITAP